MSVHHSICRVCTAYCPITVTVEDGRAVRVSGDAASPLYGGYTCVKGRALPDMLRSPERLLQPVKRTAVGTISISSAAAIEETANRLREIIDVHGPTAVGIYYGNGTIGAPATPAMLAAFARAVGTPWVFNASTIDQPGLVIAEACHGTWGGGRTSFERADAFVFAGANPVTSKQWLAQNPGRRLRDGIEAGCRVVVIDPRRTPTARAAEVHLQTRPGEDSTVLAGLIRLLLERGQIDAAFVEAHVDGMERLAESVETFTLDHVERRADVPPSAMEAAAEIIGGARRGGTAPGTGITLTGRGTLTNYLLLALHSIRGWWPREGEPAGRSNVLLPGFEARAQAFPPSQPLPAAGLQMAARGLRASLSGLPTAGLAEQILTPGDAQIRALVVSGGNPALVWPNAKLTMQALANLDLLVCLDVTMSETAEMAHYVIPPPMQLELPGMTAHIEAIRYGHPGYGWDEPYAQYTPAVVEHPAGSDLVEEWRVLYRIAQHLGAPITIGKTYGIPGGFAENPPLQAPLDMTVEPTTDDLYDIICSNSRVPLDEVRRHEHGHVYEEARRVVGPADHGWVHRLEVGNATILSELHEVAQHDAPAWQADRERPFVFIPRRMNRMMNSYGRHIERLTQQTQHNPAFLHPDDLQELGLSDGAKVRIASRHGAITAFVQADVDVRRGVVSMSHGWGGTSRSAGAGRGSNVNELIDVADDVDALTGQPRMGALAVSIAPET